MAGRAIVALWIVCAAAIAWVWLRPMHEGSLPAPVTRAPRKARLDPRHAAVAQPEDEPVAEEPTAQPVHSGPPEKLDRHDLEAVIDKVKPKVLQQCRDVEQFAGFLTVKLTIEKNGSVRSIAVMHWLIILATCTPHSVTLVTSPPSQRFVPVMITG